MHCPFCHTETKGSQHYRGEAFNTISFTHEGHYRCLHCLCEYTEKDSGRVVITKDGLSEKEVREQRHAFVVLPLLVPQYHGISGE